MAFTTPPLAGEIPDASKWLALFTELRPLSARVGTSQNLNTSSTALQNVTDLVVTPSINQSYLGWLVISAINGTGTTEDIQVSATFPAGATCRFQVIGGTTAGVAAAASTDVNVTASTLTSGVTSYAFGLSTTATAFFIRVLLTMGGTAGNLQIQAAQNTSGAGVVTVQSGSNLELRQI